MPSAFPKLPKLPSSRKGNQNINDESLMLDPRKPVIRATRKVAFGNDRTNLSVDDYSASPSDIATNCDAFAPTTSFSSASYLSWGYSTPSLSTTTSATSSSFTHELACLRTTLAESQDAAKRLNTALAESQERVVQLLSTSAVDKELIEFLQMKVDWLWERADRMDKVGFVLRTSAMVGTGEDSRDALVSPLLADAVVGDGRSEVGLNDADDDAADVMAKQAVALAIESSAVVEEWPASPVDAILSSFPIPPTTTAPVGGAWWKAAATLPGPPTISTRSSSPMYSIPRQRAICTHLVSTPHPLRTCVLAVDELGLLTDIAALDLINPVAANKVTPSSPSQSSLTQVGRDDLLSPLSTPRPSASVFNRVRRWIIRRCA